MPRRHGSEVVIEPVEGLTVQVTTWHTDEPSQRAIEGMDRMRLVRDDIEPRVRALLSDLTQAAN